MPPPITRSILRSDKGFPNDKIVKDVGKWVESVKELKSTADKEKTNDPKINRVKKLKEKKSTIEPARTEKLNGKTTGRPATAENTLSILKEDCKNLKLPSGWIGGISGNNIIFNRFKITLINSVYKMTAERGILIAPDNTVHLFLNGIETPENEWASKRIETVDDVKKVIKDADSFKICSKASKNLKPEPLIKSTKSVIKKPGLQKKEMK